jgi:hypothetical protein
MIAIWSGFGNWVLRYYATVVFDVHIQIRTRNHAASELQDFGETVRSKPMIGIIPDVRLQHDLLLSSDQSATIDKVSDYIPDFGDVGVCRDVIAIRQHKSQKPLGICLERIF